MKKIKKIIVDRDLCIGAASCVVITPELFELDDENKAVILMKNGDKEEHEAQKTEVAATNLDDETIFLSAQSCPTKAIILEDEDGNVIFP